MYIYILQKFLYFMRFHIAKGPRVCVLAKKSCVYIYGERILFDMRWLWLVGSIKLYVSFAKEPYKRDDILQKRPVSLSILLIKATPQYSQRVPWVLGWENNPSYWGVATLSRLLKIIGLFCRIHFLLQGSFAKEIYNLRSLLIVATPQKNFGMYVCMLQHLHVAYFDISSHIKI